MRCTHGRTAPFPFSQYIKACIVHGTARCPAIDLALLAAMIDLLIFLPGRQMDIVDRKRWKTASGRSVAVVSRPYVLQCRLQTVSESLPAAGSQFSNLNDLSIGDRRTIDNSFIQICTRAVVGAAQCHCKQTHTHTHTHTHYKPELEGEGLTARIWFCPDWSFQVYPPCVIHVNLNWSLYDLHENPGGLRSEKGPKPLI
jgi:hypothetical protein